MAQVIYKGCTIDVYKDHEHDDWYITVTFPDGTYGYDGWWRDSAHRSENDAIEEAKEGAELNE